VLAGEEVTFTLTAVNATAGVANVFVTDVIPDRTTFVSATAPAGWMVIAPAVGGTGTVTFTNSMMPTGNSPPLILVVRVNDGVPPGTPGIRNDACISSSSDVRCQGPHAFEIINVRAPRVDLAVTKRNVGNSVPRGSVTIYEVEVSNLGEVPVKGVTVSDPVPSGFSALTWECIFADAGSACLTPSGTGDLTTTVDLGVGGTV
jgi:uncharacterized repeat protein (TIGR01451 family)